MAIHTILKESNKHKFISDQSVISIQRERWSEDEKDAEAKGNSASLNMVETHSVAWQRLYSAGVGALEVWPRWSM